MKSSTLLYVLAHVSVPDQKKSKLFWFVNVAGLFYFWDVQLIISENKFAVNIYTAIVYLYVLAIIKDILREFVGDLILNGAFMYYI